MARTAFVRRRSLRRLGGSRRRVPATYCNGQGLVRSLNSQEVCGSFQSGSGAPTLSELALSADGKHIIAAQPHRLSHWDLRAQHQSQGGDSIGGECVSVAMSPHDTSFAISKAGVVLEVYQSIMGSLDSALPPAARRGLSNNCVTMPMVPGSPAHLQTVPYTSGMRNPQS